MIRVCVYCARTSSGCHAVQALSRVRLCDPVDCSMPVFPVLHDLPEFAQMHAQYISDAIQPSHPQHQGLFQSFGSLHQLAKVLELQLQHQSFQRMFSWFPLGLTGLISLQSKELSRVFASTI